LQVEDQTVKHGTEEEKSKKMNENLVVFDWAEKMLKEISFHATVENCSRCQKLIREMYVEAKKINELNKRREKMDE